MPEIKYDRQTRIPNWQQEKLSSAKVAVVGAGALGNHVCLGLLGLGIGTLKIYDYDEIEIHNLNRQSLFCEKDVHKNKAEVLATRIQERNTSIMVLGINEKIDDDNVEDVLRDVQLVVDCVDRIFVRRILNRFCLLKNIPLIHGGISWIGGQAGILTRNTPCINCIYPEDLQKQEINEITSCTNKPEPSVVYTSQIIAGFMVEMVRRVLLPLPDDQLIKNSLIKLDFRLDPPIYYETTRRKENCECIQILKANAPYILQQEQKAQEKSQIDEIDELQNLINSGSKFHNQRE